MVFLFSESKADEASILPIERVLRFKEGEGISASGRIPQACEFFKDHFPGFPVLPGVLALEILRLAAVRYLRRVEGSEAGIFFFKRVRRVRFTGYLKPGDAWEAHLAFEKQEGKDSHWRGQLMRDGQTAVSAQWILRKSEDRDRGK